MLIAKQEYKKIVSSPEAVYDVFQAILKAENDLEMDKEHVWALGLTVRNAIKFIELVHIGTTDNVNVVPKDVLRPCVYYGVARFILVHNHPSGSPDPSEEDRTCTNIVKEGAELLGLELLTISLSVKMGTLVFVRAYQICLKRFNGFRFKAWVHLNRCIHL